MNVKKTSQSPLTRRSFFGAVALGAAALAGKAPVLSAAQTRAKTNARDARGRMRITSIERIETLVPYHEYNAQALLRYHGPALQYRTIYIVKTDNGLEGYGESWGRGPGEDSYRKYLGTDPFDWLGDGTNLFMNMAMYDLMGKFLNVPAWKLIGPQLRKWVPVAAWTVSRPPEAMAEEVVSVSRRGYNWIKYHVDVLQNIIDQTEAMQRVAPPGFKVHYDLNGHQSYEQVYPVLKELERFPIAARIEDPVTSKDPDAYRVLREKVRFTILGHHCPIDFILNDLCDGYMAGHAPIGGAMSIAAVADHTTTPIMLQQAGGTINQAFLAHEASVFKMAIIDHVNLCHLWQDDVTVERMQVVGGSVAVPTGPGLGVSLDRDKLSRYAKLKPTPPARFLVRIRYKNGLTIYFRHDPTQPGMVDNLRAFDPPYVPGPPPSYGNAVITDFWDDEDDPKFEPIWKRTAAGPVWFDA